jgi:RNA polymerase sigma-70 factor, ECF subfamily
MESKMMNFFLSLIMDDASKSIFEQIYLQHRHTMFRVASQILNDQILAEDAVHDAFLRIMTLLEKIPYKNCNKTRSFVVIIVKNIALDYFRKRKRLAESDLDDYGEYLLDDTANPEEILMGKDGSRILLKALGKVKQIYLDVLALQISFGYGEAEIAKLLNISGESVRVRLHRGRKQLTKLLEEDE